jgi:hypothetical protein
MATYPDSLLILNGKSAGNDLLRQAIQGCVTMAHVSTCGYLGKRRRGTLYP